MNQTIDTLRARCIDVGDCWEWQGARTDTGHPTVRHDGKTHLVRRLAASLAGIPMPQNAKAMNTCENLRCVNPDHIVMRTHRQVMKRQGELGKLSDIARIAKIAATKRAKYGKLTTEQVRAIRDSSETGVSMAALHGISQGKVSAIRRHRCWRDLAGNPFTGLGARA